MTIIYDVGVLIAADRGDPVVWSRHLGFLDRGVRPFVTAPVVAQVSRSSRQAPLHRLLRGCALVAFDPSESSAVGELLAAGGTADVVDAHVVLVAARVEAEVWTSDPRDLLTLAGELVPPVLVVSL